MIVVIELKFDIRSQERFHWTKNLIALNRLLEYSPPSPNVVKANARGIRAHQSVKPY